MTTSEVEKASVDFAALRRNMVDCQIRTFGVTDRAVVARFLDVPREQFLPAELKGFAYSDLSLKLSATQAGDEARVLLSPMILARLIQAAEVKPNDSILDIACGTGYSTAILTGLAKNVTALESNPALQALAKRGLASAGFPTVAIFMGLLPDGVADKAPYDLIFINGAVEDHLEKLFGQLREGGRLIALSRVPEIANYGTCHAVLFEKFSGQMSPRILFDATAPVLSGFQFENHFVF